MPLPTSPSIYLLIPSIALLTSAITIIQPVLPTLKLRWFSPDGYERAQEISGTMSSFKFLLAFAVGPILGKWADVNGRKPLIRATNIAAAMPVLGLILSNGNSPVAYYLPYILGALISGAGYEAYVADLGNAQAKHFGWLSATTGVSLALFPLVTVFAKDFSERHLFLVSLGMLVVNGLYIEFVLPESLPEVKRGVVVEGQSSSPPPSTTSHFYGLIDFIYDLFHFTSPTFSWLALFVFFTDLPEQGVSEIVLLYLDDVLGLETVTEKKEFSSVFLSLTGVGLVISTSLGIWIFHKLGFSSMFLLGLATVANTTHMLVYASLAWNHSKVVAFSNIPITSLMFIGQPSALAFLSRETETQVQGHAMGKLSSVRSLVGAFGPLFFSFSYSFFRRRGFPQAPFIIGAVFASLALIVVIGPLRKAAAASSRTRAFREGVALDVDEATALAIEENQGYRPLLGGAAVSGSVVSAA